MFHWGHVLRAIALVALMCRVAAAQSDFAPGTLPREQLPQARSLDYEFDSVRISTILGWLRRVSVEPPVPLSGVVSGWLWAQAPSAGWWRLGDYRVEGQVASPLLGVDRLAIREANVRFGYAQGLWTVGTAQGQIETNEEGEPARQLGRATLSASLPTNPQASARVEGELSRVQLSNLLKTVGLTDNIPQGQARATFRIESSLASFSNPLTWAASGRITADQLHLATISNANVESDWQLRDAVLRLTGTRFTLPGPEPQVLELAGQLKLRDAYDWQVQLPNQALRLNAPFYGLILPASLTIGNLPTGTLNLSGATSGTLSPWGAQYALNVSNGQLNWLANSFSNVNASLSLGATGLAIDSLAFQVARGSIATTARFTSELNEPLNLTLNYQAIDLATIQAPIELPAMSGRVSGQVELSIDKRRLSELDALQADVRGTGQAVRIGDWGLGNVEYNAKKITDHSRIAVQLKDAGQSRRWLADGELVPQTDSSWEYKIDARGNSLDLSIPQLIRLIGTGTQIPVPLEILLVTGTVTLNGSTQAGVRSTEFNFSNITTLERDRRVWSQGSMLGRATPEYVEIQRSEFQVADGEVAASLKLHYLVPNQPPDSKNVAQLQDHLNLKIDGLKLHTLEAWSLITLPKAKDGYRTLDGSIRGQLRLERPAGGISWLTGWKGNVDLAIDQLILQGSDAGSLSLAGELTPGQWRGRVTGDLLQAPVSGNVTLVLSQSATLQVESAQGQLSWLGAQVSQLMGLWQSRAQATQWRGDSNLRAQFDWKSSGQQSGTAQIEVGQLAYRQRNIVRNLQAVATLENDRVRLVRFDGGLGGGRVDLSGGINLKTQMLDDVVVQLQRVSLDEAAQLLDPDWEQEIKGRVDMRARVRINRGFDVHGDVRLHDVNWSGIPINELHSGFELTSSRDRSLMRLRSSNARGSVMGGRAKADLQARLGQRNSMDLRLRIDRGEVEQLSDWTGTSSVVGKGKFDANLNVGSADFRTVRDLRGTLDLTFEDTDARTLPVADQLTRFVPLFGLPSTEFESGKLSATISQGDLRMRSLALWGQQLSVLGSGNVGMATGRLDMQLVVRTGGGLSQQVAANYLTQLAATSVPPIELLLQINRLVANRAIFLRVAGTASKPVIQPQAARMIEQALLRSLLEQAVGFGPAATAASNATRNR